MGTQNYNLPTVSDNDPIDGAEQITALANAVDTALKQVADGTGGSSGGSASEYVLPIASDETLGGVKIGRNIAISTDGTISAMVSPYVLPTATTARVGGVKIGEGINVTWDGTISVPSSGGGGTSDYILPAATSSTIGGVKVPDAGGIYLADDGSISVKIGQDGGLAKNSDGTLVVDTDWLNQKIAASGGGTSTPEYGSGLMLDEQGRLTVNIAEIRAMLGVGTTWSDIETSGFLKGK